MVFENRKSIRLKEYNYSEPGDYFITICTQNREDMFGEIIDGKMKLNEVGEMVKQKIIEIPTFYPNIEIDIFVIMPNHIHMVICIVGADPCVRPIENGQTRGFAPTEKQLSLSQIIQHF